MSEAPHKYAFAVAVVGDDSVMPPHDVHRLLDLLVNRYVGDRRIALVTIGGRDAGGESAGVWARDRCYGSVVCGGHRSRVKDVCELVATADAVVVLGDPAPWSGLVSLCRAAGVPVRVYRSRPRLPPSAPPAWDLAAAGW